ncbi:hypothetical protein [Halochromatium roseum]|uniref:hypothetical protein n=1 Tax=Halochromatium roseum TaxID=391920 RepID=UPI00191295CC|nr:hypothetical protein [Halochromatium roseum]MBK5940528.1 hypothetical protein [Halochromatium roseum]
MLFPSLIRKPPSSVNGNHIWTWVRHQKSDSQSRNRAVDRLVAAYDADLVRRDAAVANRHGEVDQARARVRAVAKRIRPYAL